ncbi:hypothetical protein RHAL1_00351 [Beijerinckiaceae bacterium RH AL1]|nr:hypothetical protein RHAL8_00331 [Beijerinckiaceae bacterium RH AL8]VVB42731.1 hypothetical protein RHCH11_RHCH11_00333 [Beijerinckiaceae bacterium RH CH11]VVC53470.1 hypothetical protein RHAL1_00351 [Beijerinckiaceae bacterium RH AL1]
MPGRLGIAGVVVSAVIALGGRGAAAAPSVDEQALRYYAAHGQTARVAAEALRLSRLDPSWHMPGDIADAKPVPEDEGPLWDLYRQGRLDEIAQAIAERQAAQPTWTPSAELVARMKTRRLRAALMDLAHQGRWAEVVRRAKEAGIDWAKDDAQALWTIAEAHAREHEAPEAFTVYRTILTTHDSRDERLATIEFAIPLIPMALTDRLVAMGRRDASGKSEFAAISTDITRARISAFLHDEPTDAPTEEDLAAFRAFARAATAPHEAGLVAWYAYKRHDDAQALEWFKIAIARGGDAMIAHGLAHTLRRLDRRREAEEVAYAWREPLTNNAILFIDLLETDLTREQPPVIEPARLARYAQVTLVSESGEGAQALAWYAYNTCQYETALRWFERATAWLPKEATVYGYALALQRLHRGTAFKDVVNRYDGLFPKVVALAFDDGIRKPRPTCETHRPEARDAIDWTGRTVADTRYMALVSRPIADAAVPVPSPSAIGAAQVPQRLRKRTTFPAAVDPENALRFTLDQGPRVTMPQVPSGAPLRARRVPGVGAMPYERAGLTLLPGYDGTLEASSPTAMERDAPVGTLWAIERARPAPHPVPLPQADRSADRPSEAKL